MTDSKAIPEDTEDLSHIPSMYWRTWAPILSNLQKRVAALGNKESKAIPDESRLS